jgi:hypothetical protein
MKTVRDLHREAIAMKAQGVPPHEIGDRLVDIAHDNGYARVQKGGSGGGGTPDTVQIVFTTGDVISFDGKEWHHTTP